MTRYTVCRADTHSENDPVTDLRVAKFHTNDLEAARAKAKEWSKPESGWTGFIWDWQRRDVVK